MVNWAQNSSQASPGRAAGPAWPAGLAWPPGGPPGLAWPAVCPAGSGRQQQRSRPPTPITAGGLFGIYLFHFLDHLFYLFQSFYLFSFYLLLIYNIFAFWGFIYFISSARRELYIIPYIFTFRHLGLFIYCVSRIHIFLFPCFLYFLANYILHFLYFP